jgi:hypothetical protein
MSAALSTCSNYTDRSNFAIIRYSAAIPARWPILFPAASCAAAFTPIPFRYSAAIPARWPILFPAASCAAAFTPIPYLPIDGNIQVG